MSERRTVHTGEYERARQALSRGVIIGPEYILISDEPGMAGNVFVGEALLRAGRVRLSHVAFRSTTVIGGYGRPTDERGTYVDQLQASELADKLGISERAALRAVAELLSAGVITAAEPDDGPSQG